MGGGRWDPGTYASVTASNIASGSTFAYSRGAKASGVYAAHTTLDPKKVAGPTSPFAGKNIRESRDNAEHPNALPIIIGFDETGSMGIVPTVLQKELTQVFGLLLRKGYCEDPQILIAAYGDAYCDAVPLQFGEFESDNRVDEALDNLFLEGNGGGNDGETVSLVWYATAHHTASDAWDKRGKKGYLFTIGDEKCLDVTAEQIMTILGTDGVQGPITPQQAYDMAAERYEVYHLVINNNAAAQQRSVPFYTGIMGDHCIVLEKAETVAATIGMIIGLGEGTVDLDTGLSDLDDVGAGAVKGDVGKALATVGSKGAVAVADAPTDLDGTSGSGAERL